MVARLAEDYEAAHIETQKVFDAAADAVSPEQWIWDGVHPLLQGHELIARNWLQEASARWKWRMTAKDGYIYLEEYLKALG